jgi:hypothetical protein
MPRVAAVTIGVLVLLLVGSQLLIPPLLEGEVAERLEQDGGRVDVSLSAFPAVRLFADDGDRLRIEGDGIRIEPREVGERPLEPLDGFGEVEIRLQAVAAGPIEIERLDLLRDSGDKPYRIRVDGSTTPVELAGYLGGRVGRVAGQEALGGLIGALLAGSLPGGGQIDVPLALDAVVASDDGRVEVERASGTIAGVPTGPLAGLLAGAVARRFGGD